MDTGNMMDFGQRRFNPIMGVMSPTSLPYAQTGDQVTTMLRRATNNPDIRASSNANRAALSVSPIYNPVSVPNDNDSELRKAIRICEAVKTDNCNAFDNAEFASKCVISHEAGVNSQGNRHIGGFVLFEKDRNTTLENSQGRFPNFRAMIGKLPDGTNKHPQYVSYNKATCLETQKRLKCARTKVYDGECSRCNTTAGNHYLLNKTRLQSPSLFITGSGKYSLLQENGQKVANAEGDLKATEAVEIRLPGDSEGKTFSLIVTGTSNTNVFVAGYLQGQTTGGFNRTDIKFLTTTDRQTGTNPSTGGMMNVTQSGTIASSTERMTTIRPGIEQTTINLSIYIPYTFTESSDPINFYCPNASFTRFESSATFAGNDPCFKKNPVTGRVSTEVNERCLQDRWTSAGCTTEGRGYPKDQTTIDNLRKKGRNLEQISNYVYNLARMDKTGRNINGTVFNANPTQNIQIWDERSQECSGTRRSNPCDYDNQVTGPLSDACLEFLYNDEGRNMTIGPTYQSEIPTYSSLKNKSIMRQPFSGQYMDQQCTPTGTMNPRNSEIARNEARKKGGVEQVKAFYNEIHAKANSTEILPDSERAPFMKQCYGIDLAKDTRLAGFENYRR